MYVVASDGTLQVLQAGFPMSCSASHSIAAVTASDLWLA